MKNNQLFRAALFILSDDGQTRENIIGKIIEISLLNVNEKVDLKGVRELLSNNFDLDITEEQLFEGINRRKQRFNFNVEGDDFSDLNALKLELKNEVKTSVKKKLEENQSSVLKRFVNVINDNEEIELNVNESYMSALINKFTYFLFQTSQNEVISFFKEPAKDDFLNGFEFTEIERLVLERFLQWKDNEKSKFLRSVIMFSFEYCMIVTNTNENALKDIFTNTNFYLDSNILVRAIGVNGIEWANESNRFLNELKKLNSNYYISTLTYNEIKTVLDFKIEELSDLTKLGKYVFQYPKLIKSLSDINERAFRFWEVFYNWAVKNNSGSISKFRRFLVKDLDKKIAKHKINIIKVKYYDEADKNVLSLYEYKSENRNTTQNINSARKDISNIFHVLQQRPTTNIIKNQIKHFFLTEDLLLYKWSRVNLVEILPIVITSTSISTFYNKYKSTYNNDDYTSYMNYIDLRHNDGEYLVDDETIKNIVNKINQISSNPKDVEDLGLYVKEVFQESIESDIKRTDLSVLIDEKLENQYLRKREKELEDKFLKYKEELQTMHNKGKQKDIDDIVNSFKSREIYRSDLKKLFKKLIIYGILIATIIAGLTYSVFDLFNQNKITLEQLLGLSSIWILVIDIVIRVVWGTLIMFPAKKFIAGYLKYASLKEKIDKLSMKINMYEDIV